MEAIICPEKYRVVTKETIVQRKKVYDWLYILDDVNSTLLYLIVGKEKALLFDTGYGFVPFKNLITEVTALPLTVVCSHGHDDHILGCFQFDHAYIAEEDLPLCLSNDNPEQKEKQILSRRAKTPNIDELVDRTAYFNTSLQNCVFEATAAGDVFDLGGLHLVVYPIPGHTKGSIALYCPEKRAIFTGDAVMKNHLLHYGQALEISAEPQEFIRALGRLEKLDIDTVWPAHGDAPADKQAIVHTREMLIDWARHGDAERDIASNPPRNTVFGKPGQRAGRYCYKDCEMSYHPGHLEQIRRYMACHDGAVE